MMKPGNLAFLFMKQDGFLSCLGKKEVITIKVIIADEVRRNRRNNGKKSNNRCS